MISTNEVMKFLKKKYNLKIDQSLIFKYAKKGLITKEKKEGQGKSKGVKTFWEDSAVYKVYNIKQLLKDGLELKEIENCVSLFYNFNELRLFNCLTDLDIVGYRDSAKKYSFDLEDLTDKELLMGHLQLQIKLLKVIHAFACAEAGYEYKNGRAIVNGKSVMVISNPIINQNKVNEIKVKIVKSDRDKDGNVVRTIEELIPYKEVIYSKKNKMEIN